MCSYESIKSIIRLLLTSASNGLTLNQLNADYQYYNQSQNIPYANFGYSTLFDFLSDMSDIAQFDINYSPPIVYAVQNNHQTLFIESSTINKNLSLQSNQKFEVSTFKNNKKTSENSD